VANRNQLDILRNHAADWNASRANNPEEKVDLTGADLSKLYLHGLDLHAADLSRANLSEADLSGANLGEANLAGTNLYQANLTDADLQGVVSCNLAIASPSRLTTICRYIYLWRAPIFFWFALSVLNLFVFGSWKLAWTIATLIFGSGVVAAFFAKRQNAREQCTNLAEADLSNADLRHADLSGAQLRGAILVQADLSDSIFFRASLREANITSLKILQRADFRQAEFGSSGPRVASSARVGGLSPYDRMKGPPLPPAAVLQYIYLLRVPILLALALFFLPYVSLRTPVRQLLGNLFVLGRWEIFLTIFAAWMLAFSILVTFRVVLLNGMERFGIQQALTQDKVSPLALILTELLGLPMVLGAVFGNGHASNQYGMWAWLFYAVVAIVVAHIVGFFVLVLAVLFSQQYPESPDKRFPTPFKWMKSLLNSAYNKKFPRWRDKWGKRFKRLPLPLRAGYFDPNTWLPYPGQLLSFAMLVLTIGIYLGIGALKMTHLGPSVVPAICYVLLLLILLNWILGMAAFFLDRYRIPLLALLVLLIWRGNETPKSDHYYFTQQGKAMAVSPAKVLNAASRLAPDSRHPHGRVVLVASEGGGIQAAAWTARVLTGLQGELSRTPPNNSASFADSIALISSVSGGAVGTMFFANGYQNGPAHRGFSVADADLHTIKDAAEAPSLDDVAWGLAYPDFWRVFFPYIKSAKGRLVDRGAALEQAWSNRGGGIHQTLNAWREGVQDGWRPALIFNATQVETGEPLLLTTTDIPPQIPTFNTLAPDSDIPIVTAVRLAATFPYVSPAAKAVSDKPPYHIADGGYYDNYGVYSLLEWLNEALTCSDPDNTPDILIIQIHSFPSSARPQVKSRGWFYQTWAPLQTLLSVRTTAQSVRDDDALTNFIALWSARGFRISRVTFEFQGTDAPLSWSMNAEQIQDVEKDWQAQISGPKNQDWLTVNCFFYPGDPVCHR
jgi:uncharacterized protein YjbI with pentapeptide repeats